MDIISPRPFQLTNTSADGSEAKVRFARSTAGSSAAPMLIPQPFANEFASSPLVKS